MTDIHSGDLLQESRAVCRPIVFTATDDQTTSPRMRLNYELRLTLGVTDSCFLLFHSHLSDNNIRTINEGSFPVLPHLLHL